MAPSDPGRPVGCRADAGAGQVFDEKPKKRDVERERTEREMSRMKDVIAEITAENLELKKTFSG